MKKCIALLMAFVLLTGCIAKNEIFVPSVENIINLAEEKDIPYTVTNFKHVDQKLVEDVERYEFLLTNTDGFNIYMLVLSYADETCCGISLIPMLGMEGIEEARKMIDFSMTLYGIDKETSEGLIAALKYDINMVRDMIAYDDFVVENNCLEINYSPYHFVFLPSRDNALDYSDENIRLSLFYVETEEYSEKLKMLQQ